MMACTHPVLYKIKDDLKCIVCGAIIAPNSDETTNMSKDTQATETAPKQPKIGVKRNSRKRGVEHG